MNTIWLSLGTAAALGTTSGMHCAAMCGPLAAVGTNQHGQIQKHLVVGYLGGRLIGYSLLGLLAGSVAAPFTAGKLGEVVHFLLAFMVAALLLYRAVILIRPGAGERLVQLGRGPSRFRWFQTLARYVPRRGFGLGLATALFPCGALLAGVFAAASSGSAPLGAGMMAVFALTSAPLLMLPAFALTNIGPRFRSAWARKVGALVLLVAAAWVVMPSLRSLLAPEETPACCAHAGHA